MPRKRSKLLWFIFVAILSQVESENGLCDDDHVAKGPGIFQSKCASCHGAMGEGGTSAYPEPLVGDSSRKELAKQIAETMPEDAPGTCVGDDAAAVADYMFDAFYSDSAQVRNRPPRIGLARLTGPQLRQSIADLYSHFYGTPKSTDKRGVKAIYFDGPHFKKENTKIERIDPILSFDFGHDAPGDGIDPKAFYIYWEGGLLANSTGRYEIIVRSTCSFVMDFGKFGRQLINNHVQSGDKTEFRGTVMLTAGRVYPFKIDFIQRERKTERPPASVSLSWIPPNGTEHPIPTKNFVSEGGPPTFSMETDLPPDDRSYGFERGVAINRQWDESTTTAAVELAQIASDELWPDFRIKHKSLPDENRAQLRSFLAEIVETAFRAPLDDELRKRYIDHQVDATEDDVEAIQRSLLISLKSPRFLYPLADREQTKSSRHLNRLALTLFDSLPSDDWLIKKIRAKEFENVDSVRNLAREFVKDYRTRAKLFEMLHEWLNVKRFGEITKDKSIFAGFDLEIVSDLRDSLDAFLEEMIESDASDFRQLIQADWTFTTDRLATFYGDAWKPLQVETPQSVKGATNDAAIARVRRSVSDPQNRFGMLTHPYLMSGMSYHDTTSPIHRGVFLIRNVFGRTLRPPSEAFTPLSPDLHPDLTTRERVALQTSPDNCQVCHTKINGLGFVLENYDAVGKFRNLDRSQSVDASGKYLDRQGNEVSLRGPRDLAEYITSSDDSHRAFVTRAFHYFVKQAPAAYGPATLDELTNRFRNSNFNMNELIVEIAVIAATQDPSLSK